MINYRKTFSTLNGKGWYIYIIIIYMCVISDHIKVNKYLATSSLDWSKTQWYRHCTPNESGLRV